MGTLLVVLKDACVIEKIAILLWPPLQREGGHPVGWLAIGFEVAV